VSKFSPVQNLHKNHLGWKLSVELICEFSPLLSYRCSHLTALRVWLNYYVSWGLEMNNLQRNSKSKGSLFVKSWWFVRLCSCGYHPHHYWYKCRCVVDSHYVKWSSCSCSANMLAVLLDCTLVDQHAVIQFLWSEGIKSSKILRRMLAQYGENFIMQSKLYQWVERLWNARKSVIDETAQAIWSLHEWQTVLNELILWFKRTCQLLPLI
jgi:hypothetical protein